MRKFLTVAAMLALGTSMSACNKAEPEANVDVAADMNTEMPMDANAAMDANVAVDANAMDANATNADATNNVTEQGSTDH